MAIDQTGLNSLLSTFQPQNNLTALRKYRENLFKKLNQAVTNPKHLNNNEKIDTKQIIVEIQSADKQIQQSMYEEQSRKLEIERLKQEEAFAKNLREKEKALAKHERILVNACFNKLLSAAGKFSVSKPLNSHCADNLAAFNNNTSRTSIDHNTPIDRDLKESVAFGIAAAEVSRRRKNTEIKKQAEETLEHRNTITKTANAHKKKKAKRSINVTI